MREMQQQELLYAGHVQGVGFRYTVNMLAEQFAVVGYVENLPDGRVHLLAEGEPDELERFTTAIANRMTEYIETIEAKRTKSASAKREKFTSFSIRR